MTTQIDRGAICQTGVIPVGTRLIQSCIPLTVLESKSTVSESTGLAGRPVLKITGIFQKADEANQNGRVYPKKILAEAVRSLVPDVNKRAVMGEFDHPSDAKIHLDRVSHLITKVWMEGKYVYGQAEVLEDMPCGKMLAVLLRNKVQVGISSRGVGDMNQINEERYEVCPGYQFVTWDIVGEPSVAEAVMHVMESKNRLPTRSQRSGSSLINPQTALVTELSRWLKGK
jgi:hypothetical protein